MKVTITGQDGFIGYHLYNHIKYKSKDLSLLDFQKFFFESKENIDNIISQADIIIHLAGLNRSNDDDFLYNQNLS